MCTNNNHKDICWMTVLDDASASRVAAATLTLRTTHTNTYLNTHTHTMKCTHIGAARSRTFRETRSPPFRHPYHTLLEPPQLAHICFIAKQRSRRHIRAREHTHTHTTPMPELFRLTKRAHTHIQPSPQKSEPLYAFDKGL